MASHPVEVTRVTEIEPHPNADSLGVIHVRGWTVVVRLGDFTPGDLAAFIEPDSVVDSSRPEFHFLARHERIRVKRLRGILSMGLLMPAPHGAQEGEDVAEQLGVTHYDPPLPLTTGGETESPPSGYRPAFDVESLRRYVSAFVPGEPVWVTEKIHGASGRFAWHSGRMYCGSRTEWKRENAKTLWWHALAGTPSVTEFCQAHPDLTVYGEVYGQVQDLKYGAKRGEVHIAVFDLLRGTEWLSPQDARAVGATLPWVPVVAEAYPFAFESVVSLAEGQSLICGADHIREGIVVKPLTERTSLEIGRVCLKVIGNAYLER